ncbi:MAG TPA: inorganic phosphate transporter [Chitinophagales bacterium]|nr:inorganic phosphate transporter [Chitinophagales bacterium]HMU97749.1 inorganic phosphate transporter [Chitinophagales bacterium]HMV02188.1 inorganic phosphate transporter [Chitinophagales bacterium]HMW94881.1 inorganic phosphate transporter [Chitinophagales bacterium]HMY41886.1 inorganic phosphate transporter [Chitinophagales bacterium]
MEFIVVIILLALIFDYINGFHDAANSIATIVSTKVLTPLQAVIWAAFFNMAAFFIFQDHAVANTIGKTVYKDFITLPVIFSGLVAAIIWNLLTWWYGIPSSSSHTLIGGFAGAAVTHAFIDKGGWVPIREIIDSGKILSIIAFIFLAPVIGMAISIFYTIIMMNKNTWIKVAALTVTCIITWNVFIHFQEKKMNSNMAHFFKLDKYEKAINDPRLIDDLEKNKEKETIAKAELAKVAPYIHLYNEKGVDFVANEIVNNIDLDRVTKLHIEDNLKIFFKVEQLKILAQKDSTEKQSYQSAVDAVDALKPHIGLYKELSPDAYAKAMMAKVAIQPNKIKEFKQVLNYDIKSDISNEISRADNSIIRFGLIGMLIIIMLSFIYNEKIKEPSAQRTANNFKNLQLLSSATFSIGHGGNDAQKVMGIIAAALVANGSITDIKNMPDWVPLSCYLAISIGTLSGGWKIIKTMGSKITKVTPLEGVCAETAGATTLFLTEQMGIPVSTTHTITGAIIGVGATKRLSAVRWGVTINLLWAWILTIPISALIAAITYGIVNIFM